METQKNNKSSIERELLQLFREIYSDDESVEDAVRDAKKAFSFIRQDVIYRANGISEEL